MGREVRHRSELDLELANLELSMLVQDVNYTGILHSEMYAYMRSQNEPPFALGHYPLSVEKTCCKVPAMGTEILRY